MNRGSRELQELARSLYSAQQRARERPALADNELSLTDAYVVQSLVVAERLRRKEHRTGLKLGFTSEAKMAQMGVKEIIVGVLTDGMRHRDGGHVSRDRFIHAKIEPEVAFRIASDADLDDSPLEECVDAAAPALEIIDSRYQSFRFSLAGVIADNTSAAGYVVGPWVSLTQGAQALPVETVELIYDGATLEVGSTAAILGHPARALRALDELRAKYGFELLPGDTVLAGAATAAVALEPGEFAAQVGDLGKVTLIAE